MPTNMVDNWGIGGATGSQSQAAVTILDKAAQCVVLESRREATQTDPASFSSAGCQTDAVLPAAEVETPNMFCELCCRFVFQKGGMFKHWRLHHGLEMPWARWQPYECPQCPFASNEKELVLVHEMTHEAEKAHARRIAAPRCTQIIRDAEFIKDSACSCCKEPASREKCERYRADCEPCACHLCPQHSSEVAKDDSDMRRLVIKKKPHICKVCLKGFRRLDELVSHATVHSGDRRFVCDICHRVYLRKSSLVVHRKTHTNSWPFECSICKKRFQYKRTLNAHSAVHKGERYFECSVCQGRFNNKYALIVHSAVHAGEKPFECSERFHHKHALNAHLAVHSDKKPFECEVCQKSYTRKGSLDAHMKVHTGNRPFECSVCQKHFFYHRALEVHLAIHAKGTDLECDMCSKRFALRRDADVHSLTHTGAGLHSNSSHGATPSSSSSTCQDASIGNWPGIKVDFLPTGVCCVACCKFFVRKESADRHWRLHHEAAEQAAALQAEPYWCPYCQFSSYVRDCVQAHEGSHSEEKAYTCQLLPPEHQSRNEPSQDKTSQAIRVTGRRSRNDKTAHLCSVCQKEFALRQNLVVHVRLHTGEQPCVCDVCRKRFRRKDALTVHQRAHEKHHACPLCGKRFACKKKLDAHSRVHAMNLRQHSHVCRVCRESFVSRERLVLHENSAHAPVVERPYECITCHESFPHKIALISHNCKLIRSRMVELAAQKATALGMS